MSPTCHYEVSLCATKEQNMQCLLSTATEKYFGRAWFMNRLAGINRLCTAIGGMCHAACLPGHYTNHSLHAMTATKLYQNNIDEQMIMEITGHHLLAIRSYKRTSDHQQMKASRCLFKEPWAMQGVWWHPRHHIYCYFDYIAFKF